MCAIGIGSNLDNPVAQVRSGLTALRRLPSSQLQLASSLYATPPMGPADQPDYINAVALLTTNLAPHALLDALQSIESEHHRVRGRRWGPRTLDLDLLVYGNTVLEDARLTLPHPGIAQRAFVVIPLLEIAPALILPGLPDLSSLAQALAAHPIRLLGP